MKGNEKQQIEQHFTVNGPADPYQRLDRSAADIKRNKQQTFDQIGKIVSGLLEHGRKQQQRQIGAQCHQVVKRKNPDQAFAEEIFGTFFRGKHDHESADTKKRCPHRKLRSSENGHAEIPQKEQPDRVKPGCCQNAVHETLY